MKPILLLFCFLISISILNAQNPEWINYSGNNAATPVVIEGNSVWEGPFNNGLVIINKTTGENAFYNKANPGLPVNNGIANYKAAVGGPCPGIPTVLHAGKTYNTVYIVDRCWLKENLDVGTMIIGNDTSIKQTDNNTIEKYCYDNNPANCEIYGGLYQWDEAMKYVNNEGAQGLCPNGWHMPTLADFSSFMANDIDGNALKAIGQGTGTNISGFSALLSGWRTYNAYFLGISVYSNFWSSTDAYYMNLQEGSGLIDLRYTTYDNGFSIRCIQGEGIVAIFPAIPKLEMPSDGAINTGTSVLFKWHSSTHAISYTLQVSSDNLFNINVSNYGVFGELTDTSFKVDALLYSTKYYWRVKATNSFGSSNWSTVRSFTTAAFGQIIPCQNTSTVLYAGKTYNTVQIGSQCWLRENLDVGTMINSNSSSDNQTNNGTIEKYCYANSTANCEVYGGLYQWNEAMQYGTGTQGICPNGWRIPAYDDLQTLITTVNNSGNQLKASDQGTGAGVGTNTSGFSGLLAGNRDNSSSLGKFYDLGKYAYFWSSHEIDATNASSLFLNYDKDNVTSAYGFNKNKGFSVRCVSEFDIAVSVKEPQIKEHPEAFVLFQNYPNPFISTTTIRYKVTVPGFISLKVFDVMGTEVATLVNEKKSVGEYRIDWNASGFGSGFYFCKLQNGIRSEAKKMLLME
ncbi:MAG: FISUMP domain-containing protein [Bacteroidales bacterium]|nr:FISUMP domain-containing protein [Bacteroidales bacterium]